MEFRYSREGDTFCWIGDYYMLRYSEPSVDVVKKYETLDLERGKNEILYISYNMELLVKDADGWIPAISVRVGDFPGIFGLQEALWGVLETDMSNAQVWLDSDGNRISNILSYSSSSITCEDYYDIRRRRYFSEEETQSDRFDLYIGAGFGVTIRDKAEPCRPWEHQRLIRIESLWESDVEALYMCVRRFMEFAQDQYNAENYERLEMKRSDKYIEDDALYYGADSGKMVHENDMLKSIIFWRDNQLVRVYDTKLTFVGDGSIYIDKGLDPYEYIDVSDIVEVEPMPEA